MDLLSPAWLLAAGAVVLPIALHLFSRGRERRVRVGSTRLLAGDGGRRARSFRPSQLLLLALRCGLLVALSLALAGPRRWIAPPPAAAGSASWVLLDPSLLAGGEGAAALEEVQRQRAAGSEVRLMAPGLPPWADGSPPPATGGAPLWSLLREADLAADPEVPFEVVTADRAAVLGGARPRLSRPVRWTVVPQRAHNAWVERAGPVEGEAMPVVVGISAPDGTRFVRRHAPIPGGDGPADDLIEAARTEQGDIRLSLREPDRFADDDSVIVPGASLPVPVWIAHDAARREDAALVAAALSAVEEIARVPLQLQTLELTEDGRLPPLPVRHGLAFWLSAAPVDESVAAWNAGGGILVRDASGPYESCDGMAPPPVPGTGEPVHLRRCHGAAGDGDGAPLWSDADGRTLIAAHRAGEGVRLDLAGRFHPLWSDLVLHPGFPALLAGLLERFEGDAGLRTAATRISDVRTAAATQIEAGAGSAGPGPAARRPSRLPEVLLWTMLLALFVAERRLGTVR